MATLAELAERHGVSRLGRTDPDDASPLPDPTDVWVNVGDHIDFGDHRLVGDATDPMVVEGAMAREVAVCCWIDPPWGVLYEGKTKARLRIVNDGPGPAGRSLEG